MKYYRDIMTRDPNKIELVFAELQSKGLLPPQRNLTSSKLTPAFRSAVFFYNTISYNPRLCGMREDTIRFSLLHEEGHKIRPQSGTGAIFLIMLAFIPCLLTFLFYWGYPVFVYSSLMYFIILVVLVLRNFAGSFHGNEFDADVFAAEILRDFYGIKKPSYVVYSTLTEIHAVLYPEYSGNVSISDRIISGLLAPLHPSMKERVNTVARLVDCY